jgi:hypothetical protein
MCVQVVLVTAHATVMFLKAQNLQRPAAQAALYLRSVCWITTAFRGLRCHPLTCMLLNLRFSADSIPSALTN